MATRSRLLTDDQIETAARFYRAGATLPGIARAYGCSSTAIRNALLDVGVPMHPRKEPRIMLTAWGETKSIPEWAADPRCPVSSNTLRQRVAAGWHPQRAVGQRPTECNGAPRRPRTPNPPANPPTETPWTTPRRQVPTPPQPIPGNRSGN